MDFAFDSFITILIRLGIVVVMLSMGLQITAVEIIGAVSRIGLLAKSLLANLVLIPLVAVVLVQLFSLPEEIAYGFLLVAIVPGAPLIPKYVEIARGQLPFSVGLMVVLALLTIFTVPLTAVLVLPTGGSFTFEPRPLLQLLVFFQLTPLLIGFACKRWWGAMAQRLTRPSILLSNLFIFLVIVFLIIRDYEALATMPSAALLAMLLFTALMLIVGWLFGGPEPETRRTLALSTGAQFSALALLITNLNFPAADITVVAFGLLILLINTAVALYWYRQPQAQQLFDLGD